MFQDGGNDVVELKDVRAIEGNGPVLPLVDALDVIEFNLIQ